MDRYEGACERLKEMETAKPNVDLDDFDEFMKKVEEVNKIVHELTSDDKTQVAAATQSADSWLEENDKQKSSQKEMKEEVINNPLAVSRRKKINKTVFNEKAFKEPEKKQETLDNLNSETMSQEAFMKSIEEDANKRMEDRMRRNKESDAIKCEANKAFRNLDYEKALDLFNKAIDVRKDSCLLYTNRALTLLNLGLYTRAGEDCDWALKLNDDSLKARLYKGRALFEQGEDELSKEIMDEAKQKFPDKLDVIEGYEKSWDDEK